MRMVITVRQNRFGTYTHKSVRIDITTDNMKTITTNVFEFAELSDTAKEKAREWAREFVHDHDWWDATYEDAKTIGLEITGFGLDRNRHAEGKFLFDSYTVAERVMKEHGKNTETYKTAKAYRHNAKEDKSDELLDEFEAALLEDYSIMLQKEYEHMYSDEYVDDMIEANEYTFTAEGKRFG